MAIPSGRVQRAPQCRGRLLPRPPPVRRPLDESHGGGTTPFIAVAPTIVPGTVTDVELDHYALLAFAEDALGITTRLGEAATAADMAGEFGL